MEEGGYLVHMFLGDQSASETAVFRKICMKYGMQSWDIMEGFLPWRNRATLRQNLCKLIRKQAISEYSGMRADPYKIQEENERIMRNFQTSDFLCKSGVLVNQKWDRDENEMNEIREENRKKFEISQKEADKIQIPSIMSIDYIKHQCYKRRISLLLYRAALRNELCKRQHKVCKDLGLSELRISSSRETEVNKRETRLEELKPSPDDFF